MSIFNYNQDIPIPISVSAIKSRAYFIWDEPSQSYIPFVPGGGGGDLPYYLKSNTVEIQSGEDKKSVLGAVSLSIQDGTQILQLTPSGLGFIGGGETNILSSASVNLLKKLKTTIDSIPIDASRYIVWNNDSLQFEAKILPEYLKANSISIVDGTNQTDLTSTTLTFTDNLGNTSIDKEKASFLTDIKTNLKDVAYTTDATANVLFVGYDKVNKKFSLNPSFLRFGNGSSKHTMNNQGMQMQSNTGYYNYNNFGCGAGLAKIGGNASTIPASNFIFLTDHVSAITYKLLKDDFITVNNLKDIVTTTPDTNSKMVIYDSTTKVYNHTAIPDGVVLPSYLQPTNIDLVNDEVSSRIIMNKATSGCTIAARKISGGTYNAQTVLSSDGLRMNKDGTPVSKYLTYDDLSNLNKITAGTNVKSRDVNAGSFVKVNVTSPTNNALLNPASVTNPTTNFKIVLNTGDRLTLNCTESGTNSIKLGNWYIMKLSDSVATASNARFSFSVVSERPAESFVCSNEYIIHTRLIASALTIASTNTVTTEANSILFCVNNVNDTSSTANFTGSIHVVCLTTNYTLDNIV